LQNLDGIPSEVEEYYRRDERGKRFLDFARNDTIQKLVKISEIYYAELLD